MLVDDVEETHGYISRTLEKISENGVSNYPSSERPGAIRSH